MYVLLHSVPPTLQQATTNPRLHQRLLDTPGHVWVSLLWGHCYYLLGPGAHKILFVPSKSLFPIFKLATDKRKFSERFTRQTDIRWCSDHLAAWHSPAPLPTKAALSHWSSKLNLAISHWDCGRDFREQKPPILDAYFRLYCRFNQQGGKVLESGSLEVPMKRKVSKTFLLSSAYSVISAGGAINPHTDMAQNFSLSQLGSKERVRQAHFQEGSFL